MVCVSGQWREMDGNANILSSFKCELGVRVTSKETASLQQAARADSVPAWFESHFSKVIKSWDGLCLASLHGASDWVARQVGFEKTKWGQVDAHLPAAAIPGGAHVALWSKNS